VRYVSSENTKRYKSPGVDQIAAELIKITGVKNIACGF
jgi:hypothetical protein